VGADEEGCGKNGLFSHNLSPLPHKAAGGGSQNENCCGGDLPD
jgi:hypothetical protein